VNPADPLAELRDIHLPAEIGAWPPALGWWVLSLLLVISVLSAIYLFINWYKKTAYRRAALKELRQLEQKFQHSSASEFSATDFQQALVELLKRTTLTAFPRTEVAGLTGESWLLSLDETANIQAFNSDLGRRLVMDRFSAEPPQLDVESAESLIRISREWIKKHR
jgi:Tfp pilus assembly protein PilO